jgi:hypothetical protein
MTKKISCRHCGQQVQERNSKNGFCYKTRIKTYRNQEGRIKLKEDAYLDCGRYHHASKI